MKTFTPVTIVTRLCLVSALLLAGCSGGTKPDSVEAPDGAAQPDAVAQPAGVGESPAAEPTGQGSETSPAAVPTGPYWDDALAAVADKRRKVSGQRRRLAKQVQAKKMTRKELDAAMKKFEAELITPEELELFKRGASNQGYHYLGSAKTFALIGNAFAEAALKLMKR